MTGDPGVDNAALTAAGYTSGAIMSVKLNGAGTNGNLIVHPLDGTLTTTALEIPYGFLLLGAGQFSSSITPSGSGKTPVVRAFPKFKCPAAQCSNATWSAYKVGSYLYPANGSGASAGKIAETIGTASTSGAIPVGICTHTPTTSEPWLGVASLL